MCRTMRTPCAAVSAGVACAIFLSGCTSSIVGAHTAGASSDVRLATRSSQGDFQTLTRGELASLATYPTLDAVMRLRPEFIHGSNRTVTFGPREIAVFVNGVYNGDVQTLNTIPLDAIQQLVFLHETEARLQFGIRCRCANGAIVVTTRRAGDP